MPESTFRYTAALLVLHFWCSAGCTPIKVYENFDNEGIRYEEYYIEHEISSAQARNTARAMDINSVVIPPGCQPCTRNERKYCLSRDLVNDHCCCDKRFHEVLPFVPHTCYMGSQTCGTVVRDCAVYERLRNCCCNKYVLQKWKEKSAAATAPREKVTILVLLNLYLYIVVNNFLA